VTVTAIRSDSPAMSYGKRIPMPDGEPAPSRAATDFRDQARAWLEVRDLAVQPCRVSMGDYAMMTYSLVWLTDRNPNNPALGHDEDVSRRVLDDYDAALVAGIEAAEREAGTR
jgi:hypothetical protein